MKKEVTKKKSFTEKLSSSFTFSVYELALSGTYLGLYIFSSIFLTLNFGVMRAGITYVWLILIGLTLRPVLGIFTGLVADNVSLALGPTGIAQWNWAYAIVPIMIYFIAYFSRKLFTTKSDKVFWSLTLFASVVVILVTFIVLIVERNFSHYSKDPNNSFSMDKTTKIAVFTCGSLTWITQVTMIVIYWFKRNQKLRQILSSFAIVSIVVIGVIWVWGPIAQIIWLNRFAGNGKGYYWQLYDVYLLVRILKAPLIIPLYTAFIVPLHVASQILDRKIERPDW